MTWLILCALFCLQFFKTITVGAAFTDEVTYLFGNIFCSVAVTNCIVGQNPAAGGCSSHRIQWTSNSVQQSPSHSSAIAPPHNQTGQPDDWKQFISLLLLVRLCQRPLLAICNIGFVFSSMKVYSVHDCFLEEIANLCFLIEWTRSVGQKLSLPIYWAVSVTLFWQLLHWRDFKHQTTSSSLAYVSISIPLIHLVN